MAKKLSDKGWNQKQLAVAQALADITDTRTDDEKAIEIGYATGYVYQLKRRPGFMDLVRQLMHEATQGNLPRVYTRLYNLTGADDERVAVQAIGLYLKATGQIQSGTNVITNVNQSNNEGTLAERFEAVREKRAARIKARHTDEDSE